MRAFWSDVILGFALSFAGLACIIELNRFTEPAAGRGVALCACAFALIAGVLRMP